MTFPIVLRHDLDSKACVSYLPGMIEIERNAGIRSTIFIRIDAITNYDYLLELQDDGWEFGLHISSSIVAVMHKQLEYLRELDFKISGASQCGSPDFIGIRWGWLDMEWNYWNWRGLDTLDVDYICGFGEIPPEIKTTVLENGPFMLDNFYVANYGRKAMDHLIADMKLYFDLVDPPIYPLLVHPYNMYLPVSSNPFPAFLFNKFILYRYFWKGTHKIFNIKTSVGIFKKVIDRFAPAIFRYKDALPLLPTNRGFVNSVLGYRVYNDFIPLSMRRNFYEIR